MYANGSAVNIQTPTQWNLIGRNMTTLPPVTSPSSIRPPPSSYCTFIAARENLARVSKKLVFKFFTFKNCLSVNLLKPESVYLLCEFWHQIHYLPRSIVAVLLEHREKCTCMCVCVLNNLQIHVLVENCVKTINQSHLYSAVCKQSRLHGPSGTIRRSLLPPRMMSKPLYRAFARNSVYGSSGVFW